jgi:Skp family chaperone for outer membrane proteins
MNKFILAILLLSLISCGESPDTGKKKEVEKQVSIISQDTSGLVISYYYTDSLKVYFEYYKNIELELESRQSSYESQMQSKTRILENYIAQKGKEAQEGLLSENEIMKAQQKAQKMQEDILKYEQSQGVKLQSDFIRRTQEVNNKVESFGRNFSEINGIDLLLAYSSGGQINFINPQMDVTTSFIDFLNAEQAKIEKGL